MLWWQNGFQTSTGHEINQGRNLTKGRSDVVVEYFVIIIVDMLKYVSNHIVVVFRLVRPLSKNISVSD